MVCNFLNKKSQITSGLIYHSTFIGRAAVKNKGRISRFLANKCSIASRIDCFSQTPVPTFGEHLRKQVHRLIVSSVPSYRNIPNIG